MPVLTKVKITRPSLDDVFLIEYTFGVPLLSLHYNIIDDDYISAYPNSGFIDGTVEEFISWKDIYAKKNELRADLAAWVDQNKFMIEKNMQFGDDSYYGPLLNPFSLTFTKITKFDTKENGLQYLSWLAAKKNMDYPEVLAKTKNSIEVFIDDTSIDIASL